MIGKCTVCGQKVKESIRTPKISTFSCRNCGHIQADFYENRSPSDGDYHLSYDQQGYVSSLETTRRRQAKRILREVRDLSGHGDFIFDYGAGRGWFLDECKKSGARKLAGTDSSEMSLNFLRTMSVEVNIGSLGFQPKTMCFLDVIEHFEGETLKASVAQALETCPEAHLVVIKVPVSKGFLFRMAFLLAKIGLTGPLHQLFQVGTFPPHFNYFSQKSLRTLLNQLQLKMTREVRDLDFEPLEFASRVIFFSKAPRVVGNFFGFCLAVIIRFLRAEDSLIVFTTRKVDTHG